MRPLISHIPLTACALATALLVSACGGGDASAPAAVIGSSGFAVDGYISGATVYSFSNVGIGKFIEEDEKTWMISYAYNFAAAGVPGLTFMSRYLSGDNIKLKNGEEGKEWERNTEIKYVVQSGALKDVAVRLRNATYRSNYSARDADEVRLLVSYSVALW